MNMPASAIADSDELGPDCAQMVITSGVLIHIPPSELDAVMRAIVAATSRYVLCIEYDAPVEQMVEYRGHQHQPIHQHLHRGQYCSWDRDHN